VAVSYDNRLDELEKKTECHIVWQIDKCSEFRS